VQALLPAHASDLTDADLDELYAWPGWPNPQPWLRVNMVSSIDGAGYAPDGKSESISSAADRRIFGRLRGLADVVLAGAGTVRAEGYRPAQAKASFVDRRAAAGQTVVPAIAIISNSLILDIDAPLFTDAQVQTIVITSAASDPDRRAQVAKRAQVIVAGEQGVDLPAALAALHTQGLTRVHSEGGPRLLADFVAADVLDELQLTITPVLAGGSYANKPYVPRILDGALLADAPRGLCLHHLLEEDGSLFASYRRVVIEG